MEQPVILPLDQADAALSLVGGKARSLGRMLAASLPVPPGFVVTTSAYRQCAGGAITDAIGEEIIRAYQQLGSGAVAVRSSATAEDLPDHSFAGQQDTFLNVVGDGALRQAVQACWSSLFNDRAVTYRREMRITEATVTMAVVIQRMIPADSAGVLFTANPLTGDRNQIIVNASLGLGESVVSGSVSPDEYIVERETLAVAARTVGQKASRIDSAEIGTRTTPVEAGDTVACLDDDQIRVLCQLALDATRIFDDVPQDIEWAFAGDTCWLLQSRPITSLPPHPIEDLTWQPPEGSTRVIRRQVVEHMPQPLSPLFEELYLEQGLESGIDALMAKWQAPFDISDFVDRPLFVTVNGYAYCRADYRVPWKSLPRMIAWYVRRIVPIVRDAVAFWREQQLPEFRRRVAEWQGVDPVEADSATLLEGMCALSRADAHYWWGVTMAVAMAKTTDGLLHWYLQSWFMPGKIPSGAFLRGYPSRTLSAQLELAAIAQGVSDAGLADLLANTGDDSVIDALLHGTGAEEKGKPIADALRQYFETYGHQIYTLDFCEPTQIEDKGPVLDSLRAMVAAGRFDAGSRHRAIVDERDALIDSMRGRVGPVRRWLFNRMLAWAIRFGPDREEALFYMGAGWPKLRNFAAELGRRLRHSGDLEQPEDIYYLRVEEIKAALDGSSAGLAETVRTRRELRAARCRLHPPPMVPAHARFKFGFIDMSAFETQKRNLPSQSELQGFAVSPGTFTGEVSLIMSPAEFKLMKPGTILVCPTTSPAWTPLFSQAEALVTDIGGILAHGSIVAREYGIPAVLGTGNITRRVRSGQRITVDGSAGVVTLHD